MTSDELRKLGRALAIDGWVDGARTCQTNADELDRLTQRVAELERDAKRGRWFLQFAYLDYDPDIPAWVMHLDRAVVPHDRVYDSNEERIDAAIESQGFGRN